MNIVVLLKVVPDVVEELEIAGDGKALDTEVLRMIPSEPDDHSVEQALLLKERHGGTVTVAALDAPDVDDALYHALACGADRVLKIQGAPENCGTTQAAAIFAEALRSAPGLREADLFLTGVQAIDDLDGLLGPLVAMHLGLPFLGIVTGISMDASAHRLRAKREYPGGVHGEFDVNLPAVLGVQAAEQPPRYVPVAKVRAAMKTQKIGVADTKAPPARELLKVVVMRKPESATHAEMLEGSVEQVSAQLCGMLSERGLV